jgi:hypothetical protein
VQTIRRPLTAHNNPHVPGLPGGTDTAEDWSSDWRPPDWGEDKEASDAEFEEGKHERDKQGRFTHEATFKDGEKITRQSRRDYTHAWRVKLPESVISTVTGKKRPAHTEHGFASSESGARSAMKPWNPRGEFEAEVTKSSKRLKPGAKDAKFSEDNINRDQAGRFAPQRQLSRLRGHQPTTDWGAPQWGDSGESAFRARALDQARRILTSDAEFKESEHKRGKGGQFTSGGAEKPPFEAKAPATPSGHLYRLQYRPPGAATLPSGLKWDFHEAPRDDYDLQQRRPELPRSRHPFGVIRTERPLTPEEMRTYEIDPVTGDQQLAPSAGIPAAMRRHKKSVQSVDAAFDSGALIRQARRIMASDNIRGMAFDRGIIPAAFHHRRSALSSQHVRLAMDDASMRSISPDGHMHVALSNISRAQVSPYWGHEIPDSEQLGLDPNTKYMLLRHPSELQKSAQTFNGLPILIEHKPISSDQHPSDLVVGSTGTDSRYEHPFLKNSLHIWSQPAIDAIVNGKNREISCAYHYKPVLQKGIYEGKAYDLIMTELHGNHVALVPDGRVGPSAVVADSMPFDLRIAEFFS